MPVLSSDARRARFSDCHILTSSFTSITSAKLLRTSVRDAWKTVQVLVHQSHHLDKSGQMPFQFVSFSLSHNTLVNAWKVILKLYFFCIQLNSVSRSTIIKQETEREMTMLVVRFAWTHLSSKSPPSASATRFSG